MRAYLEDQINSNFCETLGHKNTLPNVSNPCPKVGFWMTFANNSSHVKCLEEKGPCGVFYTPPSASSHATPTSSHTTAENSKNSSKEAWALHQFGPHML